MTLGKALLKDRADALKDELRDKETLKAVTQGRKAIAHGVKGILASKIFKKKIN